MLTPFVLPDNGIPIKMGDRSFIYKDVFHPITWQGGEPYRTRVETLVLGNMGTTIFLRIDEENHKYRIPGGSVDDDSSYEKQAENETNEEALLAVKDLVFSGITYQEKMDKDFLKKGHDFPIAYVGAFNYVYVAIVSGKVDKSTIEEKDLDDDMATNGKFYPINEVAGILHRYHLEALCNSNKVNPTMKIALQKNLSERFTDNVNKPIFECDDTFVAEDDDLGYIYHGSTYDIDVFHPMSLDLGNGKEKPGWSTFCFRNPDYARNFALMRLIQKKCGDKPETKCGWDLKERRPYVYNKVLNEVRKSVIGEKFYVYKIDAENLELGIGNDVRFAEVTFREDNIEPVDRETYYVDINLLNDIVKVIDVEPKKYEKSQMDTKNFDRGWLTCMINRDYSGDSAVAKLTKAVSDGKLKPGDDVEAYMADNGIDMEDIDFIKRMSELSESFDISDDYEETLLLGDNKVIFTSTNINSYCEDRTDSEAYLLPKSKTFPDDAKMQYKRYMYHIDDKGNIFLMAMSDFTSFSNDKEVLGCMRIFVRPTYRKNKIGTILVGDMMRYLSNVTPMIIAVEVHNDITNKEGIRKWIERYGFSEIGKPSKYSTGFALQISGPTGHKDIFEKGDFSEYAKYADLNSARGEITTESCKKADFNSNFEPKGQLQLSKFRKIKADKVVIDRYKAYASTLDDLDPRNVTVGYIWVDENNNFVGTCTVEYNLLEKFNWITSIEVADEYRGYGLGKQLLDYAVKSLKGNTLSVWVENPVAMQMYEKYGFKPSKESVKWVKAGKSSMYFMYLPSKLSPSDIKSANEVVIPPAEESLVQENVIFNKDNTAYNVDKFENGKTNILFVTGLSGSGKSTLAQKIANEFNAEWIELDCFEQCYAFNDSQLKEAGEVFYDYLSSHEALWTKLKAKEIKGEELGKEIKKFVQYCISWCRKRKDKKFVIEGVQIYSFLDSSVLKSQAIIIMGTSAKNSLLQRFKRNGDGKIEWGKELKNEFPNLLAWYWDEEKILKGFRKDMKTNAVTEFVIADTDDIVIEDLSSFNVPSYTLMEGLEENKLLEPIFIVLSFTGTTFGKIITKFQNGRFSHASLSLDSKLNKMYSFDMRQETRHEERNGKPIDKKKIVGGIRNETINDWYNVSTGGDADICVLCVFVQSKVKKAIKDNVEKLFSNVEKTKYAISDIFNIVVNRSIETGDSMKMICSQFVDNILKMANIDITNRSSNLVTPNDFDKVAKTNTHIFVLFDGKKNDYSSRVVDNKVRYIKNSNEYGDLDIAKSNPTKVLTTEEENDVEFKTRRMMMDIYKRNPERMLTESGVLDTYKKSMVGKHVYHGSYELYDVLEPTGLDMGNKLESLGWSLYTWKNRDNAIGWGIFQTVKKINKVYHVLSDTNCLYSHIMLILDTEVDKLIEVIESLPDDSLNHYYVYDIPITQDMTIGLGHSSNTKDCITIRTPHIKYAKVMKYCVTKEDIFKYCQIVTASEMAKLKTGGFNHRHSWLLMNNDLMFKFIIKDKALTIIKDAISSGELLPGESIEEFMKEKGLEFDKVSFFERLMVNFDDSAEGIRKRHQKVFEAEGDDELPDLGKENEASDYTEDAEKSMDDNADDGGEDNAENDTGTPEDAENDLEDPNYDEEGGEDNTDAEGGTPEDVENDLEDPNYDDAGGTEGTDDTQTDDTDTGGENENQSNNNTIKNYSILRDFDGLFRLANDMSKTLEPIIMEKPIQNKVLTQVKENLSAIKNEMKDFIILHYKPDNYAFNLYYYELFASLINKNLQILEKNKLFSTDANKNSKSKKIKEVN